MMERARLEEQLQDVMTSITQLGTLVEHELEQALLAVKHRDLAQCGLVIALNTEVDALTNESERLAFRALTLQQPLAGKDLRLLSSVPSIVGDLERIGDNAAGVATLLVRMPSLSTPPAGTVQAHALFPSQETERSPLTEASIVTQLLEVGNEARRMLQETMHTFVTANAQAARTIWQEDDMVDVRYHLVRHEIMTLLTGMHALPALQQDEHIMQRMTSWLWMAHHLERVGDHCTNICEQIVFFLEGEATIQPQEPL